MTSASSLCGIFVSPSIGTFSTETTVSKRIMSTMMRTSTCRVLQCSTRVLTSTQCRWKDVKSVQLVQLCSFSSLPPTNKNDNDPGLEFTSVVSHPRPVDGPQGLPSRAQQVERLKNHGTKPFDVLIVGGGATGSGAALDAATRGLSVACMERGDFASETSSRSTKLIWAGIRYMATATVALLSTNFFKQPITTLQDFVGEMKMVLNCHRERRYMTSKQRHLTNWVPIAIPFTSWHVSPPPFGHPLFGFFPILAPLVLKFYDSLSGFTCPPSYIMSPSTARLNFPQMATAQNLKYCAVFYEAQHNDARTNIAIAMSAAQHGATIANYVEMIHVVKDSEENGKVIGVKAMDRMTGEEFEIRANKVVLAGGPFTDSLRSMELMNSNDSDEVDKSDTDESKMMQKAVSGASGTHIVLPGYYCPNNMGLLDYNTSDGRFLFFLPWQNHTLIGTTDTKGPAETSPKPPEDEVQWLLNECHRYLRPDLQVRRSDVLSAWRGWRPLAIDPHAPPGAPVSRDHVISENPETGVLFIAGGKWTTWREMAEEVIDRVVGENGPKSKTLDVTLFGGQGYSEKLSVDLIQKHGMSHESAIHLAETYGGRAFEVCQLSQPTNKLWPRFGIPIVEGYPYIDAEITWACREYACTIEDVLSRRTRLAFLNKDAALAAIPRVAEIMSNELGWSKEVKAKQMSAARTYVEAYAGRIPDKHGSKLRDATYNDVQDIFNAIDSDGNGYLDRQEVGEVADVLGFPMTKEELDKTFDELDRDGNGRISFEEFEHWWNHDEEFAFRKSLAQELGLGGFQKEDIKNMGAGIFLG